MRNNLYSQNPDKLIILKKTDDDCYLVAICKRVAKKTQIQEEVNDGMLYIKTDEFYVIDEHCLELCKGMYFKKNKTQVVNRIYTVHNRKIEKDREREQQKRQEVLQKNRELRNEREKRRKLEESFQREYELAVINNNRKRMNEIINTLGYAPITRGVKSGRGKKAVPYSFAGYKPLEAGSFTPK